MEEKKEEEAVEKISTGHTKRNIIGVIIILAFFMIVFFADHSDKNILNNSEQKRSADNLKSRLNEIIDLENKRDFEKVYDDYLSPETKANMKRDVYVNIAKSSREKDSIFDKIIIHDVRINGDIGYIDSTLIECWGKDCVRRDETRNYEKFVYISNDWYMVWGAPYSDPTTCVRDTGYSMPEEFKRAISLMIQRYDQSNNVVAQSNGDSVRNIQNCLNIQYAKPDDNISDAEGMFIFTPSQSMEKFDILVSPKYSAKDDLLTAILLAHEIQHVFDFIESQTHLKKVGCFETEARAFSAQNFFAGTLNKEEINSINLRVFAGASAEAQQAVYVFSAIPKQKGNDYHEKALNFVKASPAYQKQCEDRQ